MLSATQPCTEEPRDVRRVTSLPHVAADVIAGEKYP